MKRILLLGLGCVLLLAAAAFSRPHTSGGPTYLYIHDNGLSNRFWVYQLQTGGLLAAVTGSPFSTGNSEGPVTGSAGTAAYSASRHLLFATGSSGVSVHRIGSTGVVTNVTATIYGNASFQGVATADVGANTLVFASEPVGHAVHSYSVNPDGTLMDQGVSGLPGLAGGLAATSTYVFSTIPKAVLVNKIQSDDSIARLAGYPLSLGSAVTQTVNVDASGKDYFIPDRASSRIYGFRLTGAKSKPVSGSPYSAAVTAPQGLDGIALGGKFLCAFAHANGGVNDIQMFSESSTGVLKALGAPQSSGLPGLTCGAFDPTSSFLALVDDTAGKVATYSVAASTGKLTPVAGGVRTAAFSPGHVNALVFAQP